MDNNFNKSVGERLQKARKAKGYSRAKVGELVGLHETTVKRYEDGDIKSLDIDRLKSFAKVLGTPAAELLGWISNSDEYLELMASLSSESSSGRTAAKEEMFKLLGTEHSAEEIRYMGGDKVSMLYYKSMNRDAAPVLQSIIDMIDEKSVTEIESIYALVAAYLKAGQPIRDIVDTALKPYREEDSLESEIS